MNKISTKCDICGNNCEHQVFHIKEMMWGTGEEFKYAKCSFCGSLKLVDVIEDMSKFYPSGYYSYKTTASSRLKNYFKKARAKATFGHNTLLGRLLIRLFGVTPFAYWIKDLKLKVTDPILDVGCGSGFVLKDMSDVGFTNLLGIDPYIKSRKIQMNNITILKNTIYQIDGIFKLIMFNHSLEHIYNPLSTLKRANALLTPDGNLLIRIPVIDSYAWEKYQTNWVQLDAPRHYFIPSNEGLRILASRAGLKVTKIKFDSNEFQFWGSEQYLKGIPLESRNSFIKNPKNSIFTKQEIKFFKDQAKKLNETGMGDQACYYLEKIENEK